MKWNDIPEGTSFAMSQKGVDELRAGKPRAFGYGIICGAVLTLVLQSCVSDGDTPNKPSPTVSHTTNVNDKNN